MVKFQDAIKQGFSSWKDFSGRSSRSEYWFWALFVTITLLIAKKADNIMFGTSFSEDGVISIIISLVLFIPGLSLMFRRIHDIDKKAWWLLILLIPFIGAIVILVWFCQKGTTGSNRFGPDPLATETVIS